MIDAANLLYRIKECPHDDKLYLLEKVSNGGGFFALNGNFLYMVPNTEACTSQNIKTEYLRLQTSTHISAFNVSTPSFGNDYYNFIELFIAEKDDCIENLIAFVNICSSYASQAKDVDFTSFFDSLVTLFQLPKEQSYKNLIGLFGELALIKYIYTNYKIDLSLFWHTDGPTSKIDFVAPKLNIEVKATQSNQQLFEIKHDQVFCNSKETFLATVMLENNNSGISLNELIAELASNSNYCNSLSFSINIEREKRRISCQDADQKHFKIILIRFYNSNEICPFYSIPENVSDLSYKLNMGSLIYEDEVKLAERLK